MRLIDADALKGKMKCTNRYFNIKFDIDEAPTIDPETLPIVQTLRRQVQEAESEAQYCRNNWKKAEYKLAQVRAKRNALKASPPVKVDSDAFELAARLAEVTAERDELKKNVRPVVRGEWKNIGGDEWVCTACGFVISTEGSWEKPEKKFCEDCGADMRGEAR